MRFTLAKPVSKRELPSGCGQWVFSDWALGFSCCSGGLLFYTGLAWASRTGVPQSVRILLWASPLDDHFFASWSLRMDSGRTDH